MRIVLWALQSPINIGMILRTAEVYRVPVTIFDEHAVFDDQGSRETIADFACGALEREPPRIWRDGQTARLSLDGRLIATAITADALPLPDARFAATDSVLVGNEYDGLPDQILRLCDQSVRIPMPPGFLPKPPSKRPIDGTRIAKTRNDGSPSLNVAVAASIIISAAYACVDRSSSPGRG